MPPALPLSMSFGINHLQHRLPCKIVESSNRVRYNHGVPMSKMSPIRSISKSTEVFNRLHTAIFNRELPPGTPLREAHLAKELNVSQVPVREALLRLQNIGLVVRIEDKGTYVTKLSRADMVNLLEVRIHLEELAFRLASKKMTPEIEHELQQRLADIQKAVRTKDHILTAEADLKFHKTIWKASGNPLLVNTLDRICVSVYAFIGHQRRAAGEKLAIVSHDNLLKALESGKPERIAESLREHLDPESFIPASVVD